MQGCLIIQDHWSQKQTSTRGMDEGTCGKTDRVAPGRSLPLSQLNFKNTLNPPIFHNKTYLIKTKRSSQQQ